MKPVFATFVLATSVLAGASIAHADPVGRAKTYLAHDKPRDAMLVLRSELRRHPQDGPANFMLAKLDLVFGSPVSAEREAKAARSAGYRKNRSLTLVLDSYLAQRRYIDLLHDFPIGDATGEAGARLALGRQAAEQALDRPKRASADLRKAATFDSKLPAVWLARQTAALARGDHAAAAQDLAKAKALDPADPRVALGEARASIAASHPKHAAAVLHTLLARDPSNLGARVMLANALLASHQLVPAQAEISKILHSAPASVGALYLQADLFVNQKNWKGAQGVLQRLSPVMSQLPGAYFLKAQTLLHLGEWVAAQQDAAHYVARVPADPAGRRLLAALALKNNHPHLALTTLDAAGAARSTDFGMLMLHGSAEQVTGNIKAAHTDFARAAQLAPKNPQPVAHLGELDLLEGKPQKATARLKAASGLDPSNPALQTALAQAAIAGGDTTTARAAIVQLDKLKGPAAGSLLSAQLHLSNFQLAAAKADYETALKAQPGNIGAMLGIAHIELLRGDVAKAEAMAAKAVKAAPTNQVAVSALAALLASTKDFAATEKVLQAAHKASPENPVFIVDLASLDIKLKKLDAARSLLDGASPALQSNPLILSEKAQVALARHDTTAAKSALATLIKHQPQDIGARLALIHLDVNGGHPHRAAKDLADGLKAAPHNMQLLQADVGLSLKNGGIAAAQKTAASLASDPAHQPQSLLLPGALMLSEHHPKQAIAAFRQADQAHPSPVLALNLAQAEAVSGDISGAGGTLHKAIASFGPLPVLENAAGQMALASNHLKLAAAHYQAALARAPNDVLALNNLAWIAGKRHDPNAAGLAARAYAISPTPQVADTLGWILARQSKTKQALVLLGQAHHGLPNDPGISYHYASTLASSGDKQKAASVLKKVLAGKAAFPDRAAAEKLGSTLGIS